MKPTVDPARACETLLRVAVRDAPAIGLFAESSSPMLFLTQAIRELGLTAYFRLSAHYGSMGHALAGSLGFCAATGNRALVVTGDGSLHLMNPLPIAVKHDLRLTVVVLNNALLGLPFFGSERVGAWRAQETTRLEPWDFSRQGSRRIGSCRVTSLADLEVALSTALSADGPYVIDVLTDRRVKPPAGERFASVDAARNGEQPPTETAR